MSVLYREALGLIMPLAWDEPFGLVAVESLMSGTPVVGWCRGALPEIVRDGVTGALVEGVDAGVAAVGRLHTFERASCREDAASRFSLGAMAAGYREAFHSLV